MKQFVAQSYNPSVQKIICREKEIVIGERTLIMGVLNVTPDSFSDGGRYYSIEAAVKRAEQIAQQGADIIDIGGESTRPGYVPISEQEEIERIIPVIEAVCQTVDLPISVDTYKSAVAKEALKAGAHIINDIWGLKKDPEMGKVVADTGAAVVLMHNREKAFYHHLIPDMLSDLQENIDLAKKAGIAEDKIILDPGIGFAKTLQQNLEVMNHLSCIVSLGYPVLLGTSRKSMIWKTLELPTDRIVEGTIATVVTGILQGCHIMRVHDIEEVVKACRMTDAMVRYDDRRK